jgi:type I restriction enzyme S subunit
MLFEPSNQLPNGKLRFIRDTPGKKREREVLEGLWARYAPYADANFKTAIASDFQSHFWEMYLAVTLLDLGFPLRPRRELGKEGPDICISLAETNIWIEAIACGASPSDNAESEDGFDENGFETIDESVILRYTSVINEKFRKYEQYLNKGIVSNREPFLIAVNGSRVAFSLPDNNPPDMIPNIVKAVMPFGNYTIVVDRETNQIVKDGYHYRNDIIKSTGNRVSTDVFLSQEYAGISAILFSNIDISNLPEKFGDDLLFFRNPIALNPLLAGWLRRGIEYRLEGNRVFKKRWR